MTKNMAMVRLTRFYFHSFTANTLLADGFIETGGAEDDDSSRRHHARLARRQMEEEEKSPEQIARDLNQRYGGRAAVRYTGDMNEIPQRLLMPSVHDASLWQVRVKVRTTTTTR